MAPPRQMRHDLVLFIEGATMAAFVPTGYLTLAQALECMIQKRQPELSARVAAEEAEWTRLCNRQRVAKAVQAGFLTLGSSRRRALLSDIPQFSDDDRAQLETIEWRRQLLTRARDLEKPILWQALGDGDLQSYGLTSWGAILNIPVEPWRTNQGASAMNAGSIKWWIGSPLTQIEGSVLLRRNELEHWLARIFPAPAPAQSEEPSEPAAGEPRYAGESENGQVNRTAARRRIDSRALVAQEKATSWMLAAATEARGKGAFLSRDDGITRCQSALNCQRAVARNAYTALPRALKQPRGKPAQARLSEGQASTE